MPDPIEELSSFETGVHVSPLPPAEVRRRGDRRRRRTTALAAGGAVAALVLVAVPLGVVAGGDDEDGVVEPAGAPITPGNALTVDDLPARDRLAPWEETPQDGRVLACAPEDGSLEPTLEYRADFGADIAPEPGVVNGDVDYWTSVIRSSVLQFDSTADARTAYDEVHGWLTDCPGGGDDLARKNVVPGEVPVADGQAEWRLHEFYATEVCGGECDAIRFDRMGVAQFGDRVVLVSLGEIGGPLEPTGLNRSMDELLRAAITTAGGTPGAPSADTLEPGGYGALRLGMTLDEAVASGEVVDPGEPEVDELGCTRLDLEDGGVVLVSEVNGVELVTAPDGITTQEGIGAGATVEELRAAYPEVERGVNGWSVWFGDGTSYLFQTDGDQPDATVTEVSAALDEAHCFG